MLITRPGGAPVWSISWNPSTSEVTDVLCVADWNQTLSFYMLSGRQVWLGRTLHSCLKKMDREREVCM